MDGFFSRLQNLVNAQSVAEIFYHPKSRAAKRLLLMADEEEESYVG